MNPSNFEIQKSLNMKRHLLKTSLFLLLTVLGLACRKDSLNTEQQYVKKVLSEQSPDLNKRLELLKKAFYQEELDKKLVPNIDQKLVWEPDWKHPMVQTINDSTSYVFFKLLAYVKQDGKLMEAKEVDAASYLMVKNEQDFYKALYRVKNGPREIEVDLAHFSGRLLLNNLKNNQSFLLNYLNGKIVNDAKISLDKLGSSGGTGKIPTTAYWESYCRTEMRECTYVSSGSINCTGNIYFEIVYSYDCTTPSPVCGVHFYLSDFSYQEVCIDVWFPDPPNPGGGGGGGSFNAEDPGELYELTVVAESTDLAKRLECFNSIPDNASTVYSAKLYTELADQNRPGALLNSSFVPGHTFITMTKTNGPNTVNETFGFYPKSSMKASLQVSTKSMIVDNQGHDYQASLVMTVDAAQFTAMINIAIIKAQKDYNMTGYNCTDFALDVFNQGRSVPLYVPENIGVVSGVNYGKTPSGVYQVIKSMQANGVSGASVANGKGITSTNCY